VVLAVTTRPRTASSDVAHPTSIAARPSGPRGDRTTLGVNGRGAFVIHDSLRVGGPCTLQRNGHSRPWLGVILCSVLPRGHVCPADEPTSALTRAAAERGEGGPERVTGPARVAAPDRRGGPPLSGWTDRDATQSGSAHCPSRGTSLRLYDPARRGGTRPQQRGGWTDQPLTAAATSTLASGPARMRASMYRSAQLMVTGGPHCRGRRAAQDTHRRPQEPPPRVARGPQTTNYAVRRRRIAR
jgi:hypothetical protein